MILFALGDAQFDFHPAHMVEIHHQWHERHAFALRGIPKPLQLAF